jgi:hypothetical protein
VPGSIEVTRWYFSNGDGTWTYPYTRRDRPL